MSHPFGNLLSQYRARKHGLSQTRLAHLAGYDPAVLVRMCQGKKDLTGPSGRDRILRIIDMLHGEGVLKTQAEANALLEAAGLPPLYAGQPLEAALLAKLDNNPEERKAPSYTPGIQMLTTSFGQWLKARRSTLDLTRAQVASQIGCAEITLGKIERDQRRPSKQIAELLARALHVPDDARDDFIQFARGQGEPPVLDGHKARPAMSAPLTNLPAPLTSFVDRTRELVEVCETLLRPDLRLLTLVGPPGIGKTRLSIQAGQAVLDHFADGVWFVSLAPISDPALVLPTIASIFDIADAGMNPLITHVIDYLRPKHLLLVLDNFEQVLDAAPMVTDLLKACPNVKVLATSREPLHAYGEHEYAMPALSLPPRGKPLTAEQVAAFDAIKLFVARAQAIQPSFALNVGNAPAVADICRRLEGVPLAIELAASRLRQFPLLKLRDALNAAPLQALVGTARDVEPRQRKLQSAIQWSYDLLDPTARAAFARLGVFVGGASTEAALAVCELPDDAILHALTECSLLKRDMDERAASERWMMLEMIREFALEVLAQASGDALEEVLQRHAEYFARFLPPNCDDHVINLEQHNARAALRWLLDHKHPLTGELACFMSGYFDQAGLQNEALRILPEVLSAEIDMVPLTRSDLLSGASIHAWQQHRFEEALRYGHESVALARAINAQPQLADYLIVLSRLYIEMDDCVQAKQVALEALRISRAIQNQEIIAGALDMLGDAELVLGNLGEAEADFEEAYALCQAPDFRQRVYTGLACLGMGKMALSRRDYYHALEFLHEGMARCRVANINLWMLDVVAGVIGTMSRRTTAEVCRAAKIWGAAEVLNQKMGLVNAPGDRRRTDALIAEARTRINPKTFAAAWAEGRALSLDEVIELAMM